MSVGTVETARKVAGAVEEALCAAGVVEVTVFVSVPLTAKNTLNGNDLAVLAVTFEKRVIEQAGALVGLAGVSAYICGAPSLGDRRRRGGGGGKLIDTAAPPVGINISSSQVLSDVIVPLHPAGPKPIVNLACTGLSSKDFSCPAVFGHVGGSDNKPVPLNMVVKILCNHSNKKVGRTGYHILMGGISNKQATKLKSLLEETSASKCGNGLGTCRVERDNDIGGAAVASELPVVAGRANHIDRRNGAAKVVVGARGKGRGSIVGMSLSIAARGSDVVGVDSRCGAAIVAEEEAKNRPCVVAGSRRKMSSGGVGDGRIGGSVRKGDWTDDGTGGGNGAGRCCDSRRWRRALWRSKTACWQSRWPSLPDRRSASL
ncbi:hypothetical protein sr10752 [Sporisorium reilianum SRZ2]|uniref:Uncharacterized protein n=1 Tax=Sporisorium reilianum (strain SRZ2) TaxID=999809 RepID=E6ZZQ9_SPORE|nr:hypothetical protein sr10752 [Sporisorium reilianum SRZ2]